MKSAHLLSALAAAAALAASAPAALAQNAGSTTGAASLTVGNVLTVSRQSDLAFGRIVISSAGSPATVTVGTSNAVTGINNATELTGGTITSGVFNVTGVGGSTYAVTFPQASVSLGAGTNPPTVDTFSTNLASGIGQLSGTSADIGLQSFNVGAVLHVPANTAAGNYSGTFQVNVAYN